MHTVGGTMILIALLLLPTAGAAQSRDMVLDQERPWASEADQLLRESRLGAAREAYRELTGEHGDDWGLWLRIAWVELQSGNASEALEASERSVELADGDQLDPFYMRARVRAALGDPDGALASLREALERESDDVAVLRTMATMALDFGRWAEAVGLLRELIRLEPERADYRLDVGRVLLSRGEFDQALESFREAESRGADASMCQALVGKAHLGAGREDDAVEAFRASNAIEPNADAWGGLATVHSLRGERAKSIQAFRRAIEFAPDDPDLHYNLGNVLAQSERLEEAEESYRRALDLDPESALTHTNLAVLLLNRFAVAEAEQHLRLAVQLDRRQASPHLHLGRIAGARYAFEEAIEHYGAYRARVRDPQEKQRIAEVIESLRTRAERSEAARAEGKVHLLQLVVETEERARELIARLRRGEDFYVLAHQESVIAETAGVDVGFIEVESIQEAFREPVRKLAVGEFTEPIATDRGYHVFKRVE